MMKKLLLLLFIIPSLAMARTSNFDVSFFAILISILAIVAIPVMYQADKKNEMNEGDVIFFGIMLVIGGLWAIPSSISILFNTQWGWAISAIMIVWVVINNLRGK